MRTTVFSILAEVDHSLSDAEFAAAERVAAAAALRALLSATGAEQGYVRDVREGEQLELPAAAAEPPAAA